jgi:hypothetical protein
MSDDTFPTTLRYQRMYIYPLDSNAGKWETDTPYRLEAVDEHGLWFSQADPDHYNSVQISPIRLMRWSSLDYYRLDVIIEE